MTTVIDLIQATVRLEQPLDGGTSTVGSGFIVTSPVRGGPPRTLLITADHVLALMPRDKATVGFRDRDASGVWRYRPVTVRIRDAGGHALWTRHPTQDVAAIVLPPTITHAAVPARELPRSRTLERLAIHPGSEMMALGFPAGVAANAAGFPILRSGRVASWPLWPEDRYPTYLVDFNVVPGNSGGPVFVARPQDAAAAGPAPVIITGLLTQQLKLNGDRLAIGNVTQAEFVSETASLAAGEDPAEVTAGTGTVPEAHEALPASGPAPSAMDRLREAYGHLADDLGVLLRRAWIVVRDLVLDLLTPNARRLGSAP